MNGNAHGNGDKSADQRPKAKWTVMVYLAGDNNLTPNCITVLQQLEAVKYTDDVCVLACFDSNTPWPKGSRYLAVNGKNHRNDKHLDWEIYNDLIIVEERGHKISAPDFCRPDKVKGNPMKKTDVAVGLKRFLHWAMDTQRPADHYMLVLYGHGPLVAGNTFLTQDNPISSVRMKDLPELLKPFGREWPELDILAFQNCAMNGIETAYEVKDHVNYMIGSQGLVLAYGWPYDRIIGAVVDNRTESPLKVTQQILKACARHLIDFSVMDRSSEQSVCDLSKLGNIANVTDAIKELSLKLQEALKIIEVPAPKDAKDQNEGDLTQKVVKYPVICDAVSLARLEAQSYWGETFVDVSDFCERLLKKGKRAIAAHYNLISSLGLDGTLEARLNETDFVKMLTSIMQSCKNVIERVGQMVPYSYYIGAELQYSHGLSIYFPWSLPREPYSFYLSEEHQEHILVTAFETYSGYEFCKASNWPAFLRSFYRATVRNVRRAEQEYEVLSNANSPAMNNSLALKESLAEGMVLAAHTPKEYVLSTNYLQKTDSNSGAEDSNLWSNVKNYPRRNYLSPSDCARKVEKGGRFKVGEIPVYPNSRSTPVSYLGWNICDFVADVIVKKSTNGDNGKEDEERTVSAERITQRV